MPLQRHRFPWRPAQRRLPGDLDAEGQRRDDHLHVRRPHDPNKTFEAGDIGANFKQMLEEL